MWCSWKQRFCVLARHALPPCRPAALLQVSKNKSDGTFTVYNGFQAFVDRENSMLPDSKRLVITHDAASIVKGRLELVIRNGWQGLALAKQTLLLFFSWRYTFWVALSLFLRTGQFQGIPGSRGEPAGSAPYHAARHAFRSHRSRWWPGYSRASRRRSNCCPRKHRAIPGAPGPIGAGCREQGAARPTVGAMRRKNRRGQFDPVYSPTAASKSSGR
jgi:hypothetical protein